MTKSTNFPTLQLDFTIFLFDVEVLQIITKTSNICIWKGDHIPQQNKTQKRQTLMPRDEFEILDPRIQLA
jgi:hypothetical protein